MLSKDDKYQLWLDKFNHILENFNLSEQKNNHIVELRNIIEPDFFDRNSKRSIEIYQSFIPNWLMEATDIFSIEEMNLYFSSVHRLKHVEEIDGGGSGNEEGCECNKSEDYCLWGDDCGSTCDDTVTGCGLLWNNTCNGLCG